MAQVNMQKFVGSMVASVTSIVVGVLVVILYAALLLVEQRSFAAKVANLSSDPRTWRGSGKSPPTSTRESEPISDSRPC